MSDVEAPPKPAAEPTLEDLIAPIFNAEMGARFALVRMSKLWDQDECAKKLGLNKSTLSRLEMGILKTPQSPFSVAKLNEVFGVKAVKFILLNRYPDRFDQAGIQAKFYNQKMRIDAKPRKPSKHWTHHRLKEGKSVRGSTFMGIPGEVWDEAYKIIKKRTEKKNDPNT